jgi:non-homologous end joining protein Ku
MAPRDYWKGSLKLLLVTLPITLYPASMQPGNTPFRSQEASGCDEEGEAVKDARQQAQAA